MNILAILGVTIISIIMSSMLKKYVPEYALVISILVGIILIFFIVNNIVPVIYKVKDIINISNLPQEYCLIIFKTLGICFLTQFVSDLCHDAGESAMSSRVELIGKLSIIMISLPLFEEIIRITLDLIKG